jgi:isopentenyl diphosphate isomerase/L-lactate dehydrogenase-like FMN-dependent dehydrogenase
MPDLVNLHDYAARAREIVAPDALAYLDGGALDEITLRENEAAWLRRRLRPRVLQGVDKINTATVLLDTSVTMPLGIAPTAYNGLFHPGAELGAARAAADHGLVFTASTNSSLALEEIAVAGGTHWFQLYTQEDHALTESLVRRAEAAGYRALVVTLDTAAKAPRERDMRLGDAAAHGTQGNAAAGGPAFEAVAPFLTWDHIDRLRTLTSMPLVLKGIMTGEDAALAVDHGAAAVWVSNHGGRQLDRVHATIDVLEEIAAAVAGRAEVYVDGGVRRGIDVVIALALGARAVFLGRPVLHALAVDGEAGVSDALHILEDELVNSMALLGARSVDEITRAHIV